MYDVGPLGVRIVQEFEGAPRMQARRCEGDAWELGWGSTYYPDGSPVKEGDTLQTVEQAEEMLDCCLETEAAPVWSALNFEPNQHQIDALASLAYNIGGYNAAASSVVRLANERRWDDAAASFGMWTGASTIFESNGERVLSPDGAPSSYFRRLRGLLRRHHAEGCLFLGLEWEPACANDAVFMRTERRWNEAKNRWQDYIIAQTEFKDVLAIARNYPLAPSTLSPPAPVEEIEAGPVETSTAPVPEPVASEPIEQEAEPVAHEVFKTVDPHEPVVIPKPSAKVPYGDVDPMADPKDMIRSKRFWGMLIMIVARFSLFGTVVQTALGEVTKDPILFEAATAGLAMGALWFVDVAGQYVHRWGQKDAKALLK